VDIVFANLHGHELAKGFCQMLDGNRDGDPGLNTAPSKSVP
jgi:hypothetical protein